MDNSTTTTPEENIVGPKKPANELDETLDDVDPNAFETEHEHEHEHQVPT